MGNASRISENAKISPSPQPRRRNRTRNCNRLRARLAVPSCGPFSIMLRDLSSSVERSTDCDTSASRLSQRSPARFRQGLWSFHWRRPRGELLRGVDHQAPEIGDDTARTCTRPALIFFAWSIDSERQTHNAVNLAVVAAELIGPMLYLRALMSSRFSS